MRRPLQFGLLALALSAGIAARASEADADHTSIRAQRDESGRVVFVNNDEAPKRAKSAPQRVRRNLVYWSSAEKRWKPVPPPTPSMMRAARDAAAEVAHYIEARPAMVPELRTIPAIRERRLASANPNYRDVARGRDVTSTEIDRVIDESARRHGVDPNLVRALVKVESNFNPKAVSRAGAMGLMQLMPATARGLNVRNPFDPRQNVDGGVRHLRSLLDTFNGDVRLSLAAYNAGATRVLRKNDVPNIAETKNYVKQITSLYGSGDPVGPSALRPRSNPARLFRDERGVLTLSNAE